MPISNELSLSSTIRLNFLFTEMVCPHYFFLHPIAM